MKTLDEALLLLQRVNGLVEQYALAVKGNQPASPFMQNIRRTLPTLAANLKAQFGMISDQVTAVNLAVSRGASDVVRRARSCAKGWRRSSRRSRSRSRRPRTKHAVQEPNDDATRGA